MRALPRLDGMAREVSPRPGVVVIVSFDRATDTLVGERPPPLSSDRRGGAVVIVVVVVVVVVREDRIRFLPSRASPRIS